MKEDNNKECVTSSCCVNWNTQTKQNNKKEHYSRGKKKRYAVTATISVIKPPRQPTLHVVERLYG